MEVKKYECAHCDFKTDSDNKACKHNKEFSHEMWVRIDDRCWERKNVCQK